jgi:lipoate-protein ligase A
MSAAAWQILLGGEERAERHMVLDEMLARRAEPVARFFTWTPPAVSLGWKQPRPGWLDPARWSSAGLALVERPTGGGIAVHGSDLSLAVVIPRSLSVPLATLMRSVCESAVRLCRSYGADTRPLIDAPAEGRVTYCLTELSPYAVMAGTRRVAGFALRRYPQSWLIQGSLLVRPLPRALAGAMTEEAGRAYTVRAIPLAEATAQTVTETDAAARWAHHWAAWWEEASQPLAESRGQKAKDSYGIPLPA